MGWRNAVAALLGAWFVVAAFLPNPLTNARYQWTLLVLGGLVLVLSLWALGDADRRPWRHWLVALCAFELGLSGFRGGLALAGADIWLTSAASLALMAVAIWEAL